MFSGQHGHGSNEVDKGAIIYKGWTFFPINVARVAKGFAEGKDSWRLDASEDALARGARVLEEEAGVLLVARGAALQAFNSILSTESRACDCRYVGGVGKKRVKFVVKAHVQHLRRQGEPWIFAEEDCEFVDDIVFF